MTTNLTDGSTLPVSLVTIKNKLPIFKGDEAATRIELINLEEYGFDLIAALDLYQVGDTAVYIQPDYNLSDLPIFESFIRPNGDEKKSMLGRVNGLPRRIRAKKFQFSKTPYGDVIYSNGVLLPLKEVCDFLEISEIQLIQKITVNELYLTEALQISKWEAPEDSDSGEGSNFRGGSPFPAGVYKTDEPNAKTRESQIEANCPCRWIGTLKADGSSLTFGDIEGEDIICSRKLRKKLTFKRVTGRRKKTLLEKLLFWTKPDLNLYEEVPSDDDFVVNALPLLKKMKEAGLNNILFRGELSGANMKGSGNKNNPARNEPVNIKIFGMDRIVNGIAVKQPSDDMFKMCEQLGFTTVPVIFDRVFESKQELFDECEKYFKTNLVEGIVIKNADSSISVKYMNNEYDSKK